MSILQFKDWLETPQGRYLLGWEQAALDRVVADIFGYYAVQLGLPQVPLLGANRMPHRLVCAPADADVLANAFELPFATGSLDLVLLPHVLEFSPHPHRVLREVERVLVPEGSVVISGFNPLSLWGLRQWRSHLYRGLGGGQPFLPEAGEFIAHWRLRDWLRLLQFELESVSFGCWRPAVRSSRRLARFAWMDRLGARWWPVFGAGYVMLAVKRTHGARLIGASWKAAPVTAVAPASVANRAADPHTLTESELEPR